MGFQSEGLAGLANVFIVFTRRTDFNLVVAAEAVDEAAVAFGGTLGGGSVGHGAEEFSFFGGLATALFALFGLAVEGLGDGRGAALLA